MRTRRCAQLALASAALALFLTGHAAEQETPRYGILPVRATALTTVSINNRRMVTGSFVIEDVPGPEKAG